MTDTAPLPRKRYALERNAVGAAFFALTGAVIINGGIHIWHDTFRHAAVAAPMTSCSANIHSLYNGYAMHFDFSRRLAHRLNPDSATEPGVPLAQLDEWLLAARTVCEREGAAAGEAYNALASWRYRAEDMTNVDGEALLPDAERALRFQSVQARPTEPPAPPNAQGNTP